MVAGETDRQGRGRKTHGCVAVAVVAEGGKEAPAVVGAVGGCRRGKERECGSE